MIERDRALNYALELLQKLHSSEAVSKEIYTQCERNLTRRRQLVPPFMPPLYMPLRPRAIWGFIFLLAASILVMINGFFVFYGLVISAPWVATWFFWLWSWAVSWGVATTGTVVIGLGVVLGLCLMLAAFLTYVGYETFGGIIGFICALLSIIIGGGFFAGLALGLIGGILAILRK